MCVRLHVIIFGMVIVYFECQVIEAMQSAFYEFEEDPEPDEFRWSLPDPLPDSPPNTEKSLALYEQGLKQDPCRHYCSLGVNEIAILEDCGDIVDAMIFLAQNNHSKVKPECADAKDHTCKWGMKSWWGFWCSAKVTATMAISPKDKTGRQTKCWPFGFLLRGRRRQQEKYVTLQDCVATDEQNP